LSQVDDDVEHSGISADRLVDDEASPVASRQSSGDVVRDVRAAPDQEWDYNQIRQDGALEQTFHWRIVIEEGGEDLPGDPAAA
jgi:hypothetical protein